MKHQSSTWIRRAALVGLALSMATPAGAQWHDSMGGSFNNPISSGLSSAIWGNMQMQNNLNMQRMMMNSTMRQSPSRRTPAPAPGARSAAAGRTIWRSGERVAVQWRSTWFPAEILEARNGQYKIHYTGWGSNWDEWVGPDRIRALPDSGRGASGSAVGTTLFKPAPVPVMPPQLAALMGKTPEQRQQLEKLLALCLDVFKQFEPQARPQSARKEPINDVARSLGYYIALNYYVYAQGNPARPKEVTDAQYEALCKMLRTFLLQNDQFQALTDPQKQQIHEALAILGSLPIIGYQQAEQQKNKAQQETARQLAAQNLGRLGIAPEKMQFTDAGLVLK